MFVQAGLAFAPKSLALLRACSVLLDLRGLDTGPSSVKTDEDEDGAGVSHRYGCGMAEWGGLRGVMTLLDGRRYLLFYRPFSSYI